MAETRLAELKARCPDLGRVRERLRGRAVHEVTLRQTDTYFTVPCGRLKLREVARRPAQLISYERPDVATVQSSRVRIAASEDGGAVRDLLAAAPGVRARVVKRREIWRWEGVQVHLDEVEGLGAFLELEAPVASADELPRAEGHLRDLVAALRLTADDLLATSYADLLGPH